MFDKIVKLRDLKAGEVILPNTPGLVVTVFMLMLLFTRLVYGKPSSILRLVIPALSRILKQILRIPALTSDGQRKLYRQIYRENRQRRKVCVLAHQMAMSSHRRSFLVISTLAIVSVVTGAVLLWDAKRTSLSFHERFDSERAYHDVITQLSFGPRIPGTEGNRKAGNYITEQLRLVGWKVEFQEFTYMNISIRNLVAKANLGKGPVIILGAHYDTRGWADQDTVHPRQPVPGANDGASGVAVLLELARVLDLGRTRHEIWLAFFDAEDNGGIDGWDWIVGSTHMADNLSADPKAMILVDMVGDTDQQIYFEGNSDEALSRKIWAIASQLGYSSYFRPSVRWYVIDDHTPFARRGIPATDIIDFDYQYWHTTMDTADKVSPESLGRVGSTLLMYLETLE